MGHGKSLDFGLPDLRSLCSSLLTPYGYKNQKALSISSSELYLWDNWGHYDKEAKTFHRFVLAAPSSLAPEERHFHAHIHHYTSQDGKKWQDQGVLLEADFDRRVTTLWSGSTYYDAETREWVMYFTGTLRDSLKSQSLWEVRTKDHIHWSPPQQVADPYQDPWLKEELERKGYHLGDQDNIISSFRDPFRKRQKLLFAAKAYNESGVLQPAIGQLEISPQGHIQSVALPILPSLPKWVTQVELPSFIRHGEKEYLMFTVNNQGQVRGPSPKKLKSQLLIFELSSEGRYEEVSGAQARRIFDESIGLFSGTPLRYSPRGQLMLLSFWLNSLALPPILLIP